MPGQQLPPTAPTPDEVASWEFRKLRAETQKAEIESETTQRTAQLHILSTLLPMVTTLIAVLGLAISVWSANKTASSEQRRRTEESFTATVNQFGEASTPFGRLTAVTNLAPFWDDQRFRGRLQNLLIDGIN